MHHVVGLPAPPLRVFDRPDRPHVVYVQLFVALQQKNTFYYATFIAIREETALLIVREC